MTIPSEHKRVMQICFVVPDIDAAMQNWTRTLGIGPFFEFRDLDIDTARYRGAPTRVRFHIALAQAGDVQIELAQQISGDPYAYSDMFPVDGAGGMHHIAIYVADYAAALKHFTDQGIAPSVEGLFGDMHFAYVDTTAQLGCMVEIIEHNPLQEQIFKRVRDGAESWDGVTDPVRPGLPQ